MFKQLVYAIMLLIFLSVCFSFERVPQVSNQSYTVQCDKFRSDMGTCSFYRDA